MRQECVDLVKKYEHSPLRNEFNKFKQGVKGYTRENPTHELKAGDIIIFKAGYSQDIIYKSEILGFDSHGDAFVLWDCYWFPINLTQRLIKK